MIAFQQTVLALNLLLILVFGTDCLVIGNPKASPRTKARMGVLLASLFLSFLLLIATFAVLSAALKRNALYLTLSVYAVIPFAIGKFVCYRTLRFYAALQMLAFLLSAATLCVI